MDCNWSGVLSVPWVGLGLALVLLFGPRLHLTSELGQVLLWTYIFLGWWGIGLLLAISGLRRGNLPSRVFGVITIGAFLFFAWTLVWPLVVPAPRRTDWHNEAVQATAAAPVVFRAVGDSLLPRLNSRHFCSVESLNCRLKVQ